MSIHAAPWWHVGRLDGRIATIAHVLVSAIAGTAFARAPLESNALGFVVAVLIVSPGHFRPAAGCAGRGRQPGLFLARALAGLLLSSSIMWWVTSRLGLPFLQATVVAGASVSVLTLARTTSLTDRNSVSGREYSVDARLIGAATVVASLAYGQLMLNHDSSWYLIATRQWLGGVELYSGIMEINPPLAVFLTVPALWFADALGTTDSIGFALYIVLLCGGVLLVVQHLLRDADALTQRSRRGLLLGAIAALFVVPLDAFGQREHLMVILTLPYLLLVVLSPKGVRATTVGAIALGSAAAIGFALKPHYLTAPALLGLAVAVQQRSARALLTPANVAVVTVGLGYLAIVWFGFPAYFSRIVPLGLLTYGSFGSGFLRSLAQPVLLFAPVATAIVLRGTGNGAERQVAIRFLAIVLGFAVSYMVQAKGWHYQLLPLTAFLVLVLAWDAVSTAAALRKIAIPSAAAALLVVSYSLARGPYGNRNVEAFAPFIAEVGAAPSVLVLSSNVSAAFPLVNLTGARWTSRFPAQWLVPGAVRMLARPACQAPADCESHRAVLDAARRMVVEDFLTGRPTIVIVDERPSKPYFDGIPFNYLTWLGEDPAFAAVFGSYAFVGHRRQYSIWRRADP